MSRVAHRGWRDLRIALLLVFCSLRLAPVALDIHRLRRVNFVATIRPEDVRPQNHLPRAGECSESC